MLKYVKHLLIISGLLSLPILLFSGCMKEGNDTIVLPLPDGKIPYSVIPEQLQDSLRTHGLTIHEGVNPGNIDGRFLSSPMVLHYSSDNYQELFYDLYMSFSGQKPRGMVKYSETQKHEYIDGQSYMANVIGEGNDVTATRYGKAEPPLWYRERCATKASSIASMHMWCSTPGPPTTTMLRPCRNPAPTASGTTATVWQKDYPIYQIKGLCR